MKKRYIVWTLLLQAVCMQLQAQTIIGNLGYQPPATPWLATGDKRVGEDITGQLYCLIDNREVDRTHPVELESGDAGLFYYSYDPYGYYTLQDFMILYPAELPEGVPYAWFGEKYNFAGVLIPDFLYLTKIPDDIPVEDRITPFMYNGTMVRGGIVRNIPTNFEYGIQIRVKSSQEEAIHRAVNVIINSAYPGILTNPNPEEPPEPDYLSIPKKPVQNIQNLTVNNNWVLSRTMMDETGSRSVDTYQYYDGMARPSQTVRKGITPNGMDLIELTEFNELGEKVKVWQPAISSRSDGKFTPIEQVYGNARNSYNNDQNPYSLIEYEHQTEKVMRQFAPGQDWYNNGRAVNTACKTNVAGDARLNCKFYVAGGISQAPTLIRNGDYATGELYVTEVKDEDGNTSYEFRDRLGQVVLTRQMDGTMAHDTYYVYDDYGNKCFVLPPRIDDEGITQARLDELAYRYKYDNRNRQIARKIPGSGWVYYIYDKADRLIFTQDGNLRDKGEWMFSIPDAFGRIVLAGTCKDSLDYAADPLKNAVVKGSWTGGTNANKGYTVGGVALTSPTVLSANYYDSYDFMNANGIPAITDADIKPETVTGYGVQYTRGYKGLLTGTLTAQMNAAGTPSSTCLYSVMYYDNRGRVIQTKSSNHLDGGIDKEYIAYDFVGQVTRRKHVHMATGKTTQTEVYTYTYDHAGRLLATTHQLNTNPETTLAENMYDELGRLESVMRNEQDSLKTNYTYNVRSWMKSITSPLFSQTLYYNDRRTNGNTNTPSYTGNISAMDWKVTAAGDNRQRGYDFSYDGLSRLTGANYLENNAASTRFSTSYTYDKHGNMLSLLRSGNQGTTTYGVIDNLTLAYNGNQLVKVEDTAVNPTLSMSMDFRNGADQAVEYTYDKNGNQIKDLNKGIINTEYNLLNLPRRITFNHTNNPVNEYVYSAAGAKLSVTHKNSSTQKQTDYVGNMIYENGVLKRILIEGGYIEDGVYHFYIQDHLGNNRVVAKQDGTIVQANHYYPFGMSFAESTYPDKQPYKFNGKELDTQNGLNLYDSDARMYNPVIPHTSTPDPLAEKYYSISPYAWVGNNPMNAVDPTGMWIQYNDSTGNYRYNNGQWEKYQTSGTDIGKYTAYTPASGSFLEGVLNGLNQLDKNVTGNNLLKFFANDNNNAFIVSGDDNTADISNSALGKITLSPEFQGSDIPTENDIQTSPFWLDLGHELAHRQDVLMNGSKQARTVWLIKPDDGKKVYQSEKYATHLENKMRAESNLPLRTHYVRQGSGGWEPSRILVPWTRISKFNKNPIILNSRTYSGVGVPYKY